MAGRQGEENIYTTNRCSSGNGTVSSLLAVQCPENLF